VVIEPAPWGHQAGYCPNKKRKLTFPSLMGFIFQYSFAHRLKRKK